MKKALIFSFMVILVIGLILTGCAKQTTSPSTTAPKTSSPTAVTTSSPTATTTSKAPQYGGRVRIMATGGVKNLGIPGLAYAPLDMGVSRTCVEALLTTDQNAKVLPFLATTWQYSSDFKSLTLNLRQGVKFHDGTDFNADAVKTCLDLNRPFRADLNIVSSVDVVDANTVRINFSSTPAPNPFLIVLSGVSGRIVSPTALKSMGDAAALHPVGTGPFKFASYEKDVVMKFDKFTDYWQKGKPYLDGMDWYFIADPLVGQISLQKGELDALTNIDAKTASDLAKAGFNIVPKPLSAMGIAGDSAHPDSPFANIKVRQAVAYAIDNQAVAKATGLGYYQATNQYAVPGSPYYNPAVVGYPFNPQKAKDLLSAAGYPNGFQTKLSYQTGATYYQGIATAAQGYLKDVGVDVTLDPADAARWTVIQTQGWNKQLIYLGVIQLITNDPVSNLLNYMSSKATFYTSKSLDIPADYDSKVQQAYSEPDAQKRITMLLDLNKMIIDQYCIAMPIQITCGISACNNNISDASVAGQKWNPGIVGYIWNPEDAWLNK